MQSYMLRIIFNRVKIIYELVKFMLVVKGTEVARGCLRKV